MQQTIKYIRCDGNFTANKKYYLRVFHIDVPGINNQSQHIQDFICRVKHHVMVDEWLVEPIRPEIIDNGNLTTKSYVRSGTNRNYTRPRSSATMQAGFLQWENLNIRIKKLTGSLVIIAYYCNEGFKLFGNSDTPINAFSADLSTLFNNPQVSNAKSSAGSKNSSESRIFDNAMSRIYNSAGINTTLTPTTSIPAIVNDLLPQPNVVLSPSIPNSVITNLTIHWD